MEFELELDDGKYTYIFNNGKQKALRYGEEWRDLVGDNLIYAMALRIKELEDKLYEVEEELESERAGDDW